LFPSFRELSDDVGRFFAVRAKFVTVNVECLVVSVEEIRGWQRDKKVA
jgi:hypothetical protein